MVSHVSPAPAQLPRSSIAIATFSTVVEWYDFTLYLFMTTVLSRVFFGGGDSSVLTALAVFAIGYLLRPLGALMFGHIGDRYGRRTVLLGSMAVMATAMLATALLPTRAAIGPAAGALLLGLRCVMSFSVGGEYTGVLTYLVEGAAPRRRGLVASLAAGASEVGALLAVAVAGLTTATFSGVALDEWGWRIPFLFGALLAFGTLLARSSMRESPEFESQRPERPAAHRPLNDALRGQRAALYRTFTISALASITYYVGITYVPTYLTSVSGAGEADSLGLSVIASVAVIAISPAVGALSDRWGRRGALLVLAGLSVVLPPVLFSLMSGGDRAAALSGAVVLACIAGGLSALGASANPEQFTTGSRLSGLAVGTVATSVFGGLTPYLSQFVVQSTGWTTAPGALVSAVAVAALPVLLRLPETAPSKFVTTTS